MKVVTDSSLRVYIVWLPMLRSDHKADAEEASGEFTDSRVSYFWDSEKILGEAYSDRLNLFRTAWDVYLLYGRAARWEVPAPDPDYWMHQLGLTAPFAPTLDESELTEQVILTLKAQTVQPQ